MQSNTLFIPSRSPRSQAIANSEATLDAANVWNSIMVSEPTGASIKNSVVVSEPAGSGPSEFMIIAIVLGLVVGIPLAAGINFVIYRCLFNFVRKKVLRKYQKE
jgi:hypothetical protein